MDAVLLSSLVLLISFYTRVCRQLASASAVGILFHYRIWRLASRNVCCIHPSFLSKFLHFFQLVFLKLLAFTDVRFLNLTRKK